MRAGSRVETTVAMPVTGDNGRISFRLSRGMSENGAPTGSVSISHMRKGKDDPIRLEYMISWSVFGHPDEKPEDVERQAAMTAIRGLLDVMEAHVSDLKDVLKVLEEGRDPWSTTS